MTIFVVSFAPEHNWFGVELAVGVAAGLPLVAGVALLVGLHWNVAFCDFNGASEMLSEV